MLYPYLTYIKYFFIIIFIILFFFILYIRNKFKFWTIQPVFHIYDISYYFFPPGIIEERMPEKNKYCNFKNIEFIPYSKLSDIRIKQILRFIQKNYLKNKENIFKPERNNFDPYFIGHNCDSFFSLYLEDELLLDTKTNESIENKKIVSVMTTRPLHVFINNGNKDSFFDVYYVDYLCVDRNNRKSGIAPQMIQTHEYYQRLKNKNIKVSLFKREGDLTGIVPLCIYSTYGFKMDGTWNTVDSMFHPSLAIIEIGGQNIHILTDFIRNSHKKFDIVILPETTHIMELVKTKNLFVYIVVEKGQVLCAYFFTKSCTYMKKGVEVLAFTASINKCKDNRIFVLGYKLILQKICKTWPEFKYATIEDNSDNGIILKSILKEVKPDIISPTAYFFYNFAYVTLLPKKVFIIH